MGSVVVEQPRQSVPPIRIVDLATVRPIELDPFWELDIERWRKHLYWDERPAIESLRRSLQQGHLQGKAARLGERVVGFIYYLIEGERAVISGIGVYPGRNKPSILMAILSDALREFTALGVRRVETQFIAFDEPWIDPCFVNLGFSHHRRRFLRRSLKARDSVELRSPTSPIETALGSRTRSGVAVESWARLDTRAASRVMAMAHEGRVDAEMNELYRTADGCRLLLDNILQQRGCGLALTRVSAAARAVSDGSLAGFCLVTEILDGHAHIAQLAVMPSRQQKGVGRRLLRHALDRLQRRSFYSVSLMVSEENLSALRLYRQLGFRPTLSFPVFCKEVSTLGSRQS